MPVYSVQKQMNKSYFSTNIVHTNCCELLFFMFVDYNLTDTSCYLVFIQMLNLVLQYTELQFVYEKLVYKK